MGDDMEQKKALVWAICKACGIDPESVPTSTPTPSNDGVQSEWMTRREAADYARRSTDTIDNWCSRGYVERCKLAGGRAGGVLIRRKSLEKFIASKVIKKPKTNAPVTEAPSQPETASTNSNEKEVNNAIANNTAQ